MKNRAFIFTYYFEGRILLGASKWSPDYARKQKPHVWGKRTCFVAEDGGFWRLQFTHNKMITFKFLAP